MLKEKARLQYARRVSVKMNKAITVSSPTFQNLIVILMVLLSANALASCSAVKDLSNNSGQTLVPPPTFSARNIYYVDGNRGSDSNSGAQATPFLTIQKCLNIVQAGGTCNIEAGTYNESLTLRNSGAAGASITLKAVGTVVVNSGASVTLQTSGEQGYYTFDGLSFVSTFGSGSEEDSGGQTESLNFKNGVTAGGGFVIENCTVQGMAFFNGSNNTVQNCVFDGSKSALQDAIHFYGGSNNVAKNNTVHDYIGRGIWTSFGSSNTSIDGNTIYNVQNGIDCDGASIAVTSCNVTNNMVYDAGSPDKWGTGIFLEDSFNGLVKGNAVYNIINGAGFYAVNYGNGGGSGWITQGGMEYRNQDTNTVIENNLIYNYPTNPCMLIISASGLRINHNTCANGTQPGASLWFRVTSGTSFYPVNETVEDNVFYSPYAAYAIQMDNSASLASTFLNNIYDTKGTVWKIGSTTYTLAQVQSSLKQDADSLIVDPKFVNAAQNNYHLQAGSPAIGNASDKGNIGAY